MADLLVITPTRGRPENIEHLLEAWTATATGHAHLALCIDNDDPTGDAVTAMWHDHHASATWHHDASGVRTPHEQPWLTRHKGLRKRLVGWTNAVALSDHGYRFVASFGDDHVPRTIGWDEAICEALDELGTGFVYPDDGYEHENLPTAVAMTSNIPKALGWMALPTSRHLYIDHVWRDLGRAIDRYRYLPDVLVEHQSTYNGKADQDETSRDHWAKAARDADERAYAEWCAGARDRDVAKLRRLL